jgi:NNP family nitrate/nitrite transporter-like MFS transporter
MSPQFVRQIVKMTPHSTDTGSFCNLYLTQIYLDTLGWLIAFNSTGRLEEVFQYSIDTDPRSQDDISHAIRTYGFAVPTCLSLLVVGSSFTFFYLVRHRSSPFRDQRRSQDHQEDVWTSSIVGVGGTILMRFIPGPMCDRVRARILFTLVLCTRLHPTACRFCRIHCQWTRHSSSFHWIAGGSFVMCQYWTCRMFYQTSLNCSLVGGWGNLGGGVTQLVMGSLLFPLFKIFF